MTKLSSYQITQFHKQDLDMIQVLEWSNEEPYRILVGKFHCIQTLFIDPLLNQLKYISDLGTDINMDYEENFPYQEGVISETYQRPNRSYFQKPPELVV